MPLSNVHKLAVIGSRGYHDRERVFAYLDKVLDKLGDRLMLVSGAATNGPDAFAEIWAKKRGVPILLFPADWSKGKGAGHARNTKIVDAADTVVAFWDGSSPGTKDSISKAFERGKRLMVSTLSKPVVTEVRDWEELTAKL